MLRGYYDTPSCRNSPMVRCAASAATPRRRTGRGDLHRRLALVEGGGLGHCGHRRQHPDASSHGRAGAAEDAVAGHPVHVDGPLEGRRSDLVITSYGATTSSRASRAIKPWMRCLLRSLRTPTTRQGKRIKLAWIDLETTAVINVAVTDIPDYGTAAQRPRGCSDRGQGDGVGHHRHGRQQQRGLAEHQPRGRQDRLHVDRYSPDGHAEPPPTRPM